MNVHEHRLIMWPIFDMRQCKHFDGPIIANTMNEHEHCLIMWPMLDISQCKQLDGPVIAYTYERTRTSFNHVANVRYGTM